ncbi:MAG: glycoside hydrolase family 15 protein, partial [Alphaproteobacteria bacterium]|nr:glycoside hydrolase family 15 protein [Alphaproteobacteria bacterium]
YWRQWVRGLAIPFDWQEQVIRAAIALKLCSYEDTGAVVAALTTSIPEAPGSGRNWDYRYCWLRDAFFTVHALNRLGATRTMEGLIRFVTDAALPRNGGTIAPLYPIAPSTPVAEREAPALPGYRGMGPVRIGNAAVLQQQNDVHGSIILTAAQTFWDSRLGPFDDVALYEQLRPVAEEARRVALSPDAGPWEYRGREHVHTYSAAMCWAGLNRMGMIARRLGREEEAQTWLGHATALRQEILRRATTADGWISGALDCELADASSLLLHEIGLIAPCDERVARTLALVEKRLMRNGLVMRYCEADDFGLPETAFLVCSFWYVDALAGCGRRQEATELFQALLSRRNHAGLLSEDAAPATGELWGNYPQTYSQVGVILAALRLSRSWEEGLWRAS